MAYRSKFVSFCGYARGALFFSLCSTIVMLLACVVVAALGVDVDVKFNRLLILLWATPFALCLFAWFLGVVIDIFEHEKQKEKDSRSDPNYTQRL